MATAFRELDVEQLKGEIGEKFEQARIKGERPNAVERTLEEKAARLIEIALRRVR